MTTQDSETQSFSFPKLSFELDATSGQESLIEKGLYFSTNGQFCHIETNSLVTSDYFSKQEHKKIQTIIHNYIWYIMQSHFKLKKVRIPTNKELELRESTIFTTPTFSDDKNRKNTLFMIINGGGTGRSGMLATKLCIYDNICLGTVFPFITQGLKRDWDIIIFDPNGKPNEDNNDNSLFYSGDIHVKYVFESYILPIINKQENKDNNDDEKINENANKKLWQNIVIFGHSAGGFCIGQLIYEYGKILKPYVKCVAITDCPSDIMIDDWNILNECGRHWIASKGYNLKDNKQYLKVDTVIPEKERKFKKSKIIPKKNMPKVSAGHPEHGYTNASSFHSIFKFFDEKLCK
eukprot:140539_1